MPSRSEFAVRFAATAALLLTVAGLLAALLLNLFPPSPNRSPTHFPIAFAASTLFLGIGSVALMQARGQVRRERQKKFRNHLVLALSAGTLFVATQTYALTCMVRQQHADQAELGAGPYIVVIVALHAIHFIVALLFVTFITVQAFENRYDHEYFWGVTICMWFWHILGIVWVIVLVVATFAAVRGD